GARDDPGRSLTAPASRRCLQRAHRIHPMKAPHRIFATAAAGAIAAAALTGCASGTPEERAQALAEDFVAWVIEDIYMAGENPSEEHKETAVREDPFDGICEGALEDVTSEISWIS